MTDDPKPASAPAAVPAKAAPAKPSPATTFLDEVDAWFRDHFVGTALGGTTELYNLAHEAKENLKSRLAKL